MKTTRLALLLAIAIPACDASVSNDDPAEAAVEGPQGPRGERGPRGATGLPGLPAAIETYKATGHDTGDGTVPRESIAWCREGDVVLAGGCSFTRGAEQITSRPYREDGVDAWQCASAVEAGEIVTDSYAICLVVDSDAE